jgi:hypothetical protein
VIGQVQSFPSGILELLGLKGTGNFPNALSSAYAPTLPMLQMLGRGTDQHITATNAAAAQGAAVTVTVPQNQLWLVTYVSARYLGAVAITDMAGYLMIGTSTASSTGVATSNFGSRAFTAGFYDVVWVPPNPWVCLSGDVISAVMRRLVGVANTSVAIQVHAGVFQA